MRSYVKKVMYSCRNKEQAKITYDWANDLGRKFDKTAQPAWFYFVLICYRNTIAHIDKRYK